MTYVVKAISACVCMFRHPSVCVLPPVGLLCMCVWQYSEGLLCVSPSRGTPVCVSRYRVTLMCQLCLEEWTESWWTTVTQTHTHAGNLLRALPMITAPHPHTHSWHFSSKDNYRLPIYGCSMTLSWNPQALQKFLSLYICIYCISTCCVCVYNRACLFTFSLQGRLEFVCVFVH